MDKPWECYNAMRGDDDWVEGSCGHNPGELLEMTRCLKAVTEKLPKCYRLKDGKLVHDVPMTPGMRVYRNDNRTVFREVIVSVHGRSVCLRGKGRPYYGDKLATSFDAATKLMEKQ